MNKNRRYPYPVRLGGRQRLVSNSFILFFYHCAYKCLKCEEKSFLKFIYFLCECLDLTQEWEVLENSLLYALVPKCMAFQCAELWLDFRLLRFKSSVIFFIDYWYLRQCQNIDTVLKTIKSKYIFLYVINGIFLPNFILMGPWVWAERWCSITQ